MKRKHQILLALAVAIWVAENIYFGWNAKPQSSAESFWDSVSAVIFLWAIVGDILSGLQIHKHYNDSSVTNITTDTVKVEGKTPTIHYHFGTTKDETIKLLKNNEDRHAK